MIEVMADKRAIPFISHYLYHCFLQKVIAPSLASELIFFIERVSKPALECNVLVMPPSEEPLQSHREKKKNNKNNTNVTLKYLSYKFQAIVHTIIFVICV